MFRLYHSSTRTSILLWWVVLGLVPFCPAMFGVLLTTCPPFLIWYLIVLNCTIEWVYYICITYIINLDIFIKNFSFLTAPFAAGPLADIIGRKWTLLSSTLFFAISYILLVTAATVGQMYAARLFQVSQFYQISPTYVSKLEVLDNFIHIR